jgi:autotransporter-associated beta strand protein
MRMSKRNVLAAEGDADLSSLTGATLPICPPYLLSILFALLALIFCAPPIAQAATRTWTGGGPNDNASVAANWGGTAPVANDDIAFAGTIRLTPNQNSVGTINSISFNSGAGAFTLGGALLTISSGGITNNSVNTQTINNAITLSAAQNWSATSGSLVIGGAVANGGFLLTIGGGSNTSASGIISGTGGLTKSGAGTLTLSGANTYTGATTISLGTLRISASDRIANGSALNVSGGIFDLQTFNETVASVTLASGSITGTGTATLTSTSSFDLQSGTVTAILGGTAPLTKTTAGTVSLTGVNTYTGGTTINAGTLAINSSSGLGASSGTATINAGTLELLTGNTVSTTRSFNLGNAASTFQIDSGSSFTISGTISNAAAPGSLNKTGAGTLNLTGANTFGGTGQTVAVLGGILQVSSDTNLGNAANTITFNGGTEMFLAGFNSARAVLLTGGGTFNTNNNSVGLTGTISGAGTFTKTGAGTLTLSGTNTYSGGTSVTGGNASILRVSADNNLGSTSAPSLAAGLTLGNGAVLETTASFSTARRIFLGATGGSNQADGSPVSAILFVDAGTSLTLTGQISGGANTRLEKDGAGWLYLSNPNLAAPNQFTSLYLHGGLIITSTGPQFGNAIITADNGAGVVGNQVGAFTGTIHIGNGGHLRESGLGFDVFRNGLIDNVAGQTGGLTFTGDETAPGGAAANAGKQGLGGTNTFVGSVSIGTNFTLSISQDANLGSASNQLTINGGTLTIEDGVTGASPVSAGTPIAATFATTRQINLNGSSIIDVRNTYDAVANPTAAGLGTHVNTLTLNGLITGSGSLIKTGPGILTLNNAANNYTGGTTINAGILSIANPNVLGANTSALTINPNGIFQATASFTDSRMVTLGGTGGLASGGTFDVTSGVTESRAGVISGSGSLTKTGSGILELTAVNTYTGGTFVNGGTLVTTGNQSMGPQPTLGSSLYAIHLANGTTLRSLETSASGTRQIELVSGTATFDIGTSFTQQRDGLIYGSGGLIKTGDGTQILTNANTYTGGTTINGGILQINNTSGSGTGTGAVTINNGATLSGWPTAGFAAPGSISGTVNVNSGGSIDIRSGGTFTFGGLVLNASAITNFQLGAPIGTALINITGTNGLSLSGLSTINISNFAGGLSAGIYHLFDYSGTALANLNNLQLGSTAGGAFTYSLSNNQTNTSIDLIVSAAGSSQWDNDASGNWSATTNWTNGIPPNSAGGAANFLGVINSPRTVTVDGAFTSGTMTFNNANSYTIASDGVAGHGITLNNNGSASITVLAGSHTISAPLALTDNVEIAANSGTLLTISGPISENSAGRTLTTSGQGAVTFSGATANTYTGLTDVEAGTLNLNKTGGVNAIGPGGLQIDLGATVALFGSNQIADTAIVTDNGTFALGTFSETIAGLNGTGGVTIGAGSTLTIGSSNTVDSQFRGVISGPGTITKAGLGTLDLHNANTFGGSGQTITIQAGTLQLDADSNLGNSANSLTFTGGTLTFERDFSSARQVFLNGPTTIDTANNSATFSGVFSGGGSLIKAGDGTLILGGANTYSGGTILNAGTLSITSNGNLGTGSVQLNNGSTLLTNGSFNFTHGFVLGAPTGPVQADGLPVSGIINVQSGTLTETTLGITDGGAGGRLMKIGPGTLDLQVGGPAVGGNTAFTGGIYLHEGTLKISTIFAGGTNAVLTIDNAATLIVNASSGGVRSVGQFKLGNGGAFVGETSGNTSFGNGVISNISGQFGGLTFIGPGKNGLGGNNTFVGAIAIGNPATPLVPVILSISRDVNLGAAGNQLSIGNGSTLMIEDGIDATQPVGSAAFAATFSTGRQINLTGSTAIIDVENTGDAVNYNPAFNPGGLNTLAAHTNVLTIDGLVTGSGQLIKAGPGTLVLTNTGNNYTGGTTINAGTLSITDGSEIGAASSGITINPTGIFQLTGTFTSARVVTLGGTGGPSSGGTFEITGTNNATRLGLITGSGSLTKTGTGTLSLFGANDYSGGTYINAGTVAINNSNSLGATSGNAVLGNATLQVVSDVTSGRNLVVGTSSSTIQVDSGATFSLSGNLSGSGSLTKNGTGTLTLTGTNTFTGNTTVNYGTLIAAGSSGGALATTAAITVNDSGTLLLGASNQISDTAPITLNGGTIAKGNFSEGSTSTAGAGALTLNASGSHLDFGTGTAGTLTFASFTPGAFTLTIDNWSSFTTDRLIFASDQSTNLSSFTFTGYGAGAIEFDLGGGFYEITPASPVPEPSTYVAGALALGALAYHQRRRFRRKVIRDVSSA